MSGETSVCESILCVVHVLKNYHFARSRLGVGDVSEEGIARGTARFSVANAIGIPTWGGAFKSCVFEEEGAGGGESLNLQGKVNLRR
jgi:hypothetical protein